MTGEQTRFAIAAAATVTVLITGAYFKQKYAHQKVNLAHQHLAVGSVLRASPSNFAPPDARLRPAPRPPDPSARVSSGPPHMFHVDPAHTNRSPFHGVDNPVVTTLIDLQSPIQTAPAVRSDGTIVVGTMAGDIVGVTSDGTLAFKKSYHHRIYSSPLVIDNTVFFGLDDKRFVAVLAKPAAKTPHGPEKTSTKSIIVPTELWSLGTDGDADTAAVAVSKNTLAFASHQTVYAVRTDGTIRWRVKAKRKVFSSPAAGADGSVYFGAQDRRIYGITPRGNVRFSVKTQGDVDCAPSVEDDGTVVVGTDGGSVWAIDGKTGNVKWKTDVGGHVRGGVTLTRSHDIVVGVYGPSPRVVRLQGNDGTPIWSFSVPSTGSREYGVHGSPVEDADGNLVFGSQDDAVYCLDANGNLRWKIATQADVDAPVVLVSDGVIVAASDDGKLYRITQAPSPSISTSASAASSASTPSSR